MRGHDEDREELFEDSIREQLEGIRPKKARRRRRNWISPVALLVVGGMLLSIIIRFLMGLS